MLLATIPFLRFLSIVHAQRIVWHDEFNGTRLDPLKWTYDVGSLNVNNELEYYQPFNVWLNGAGQLVITARAEPAGPNGLFNYTSGRIHTQNLVAVQYGRVEARLKVPMVAGLWPAFWMQLRPRRHGWCALATVW